MADIFISYKSEDREIAEALSKVLEAHGWSTWWDTRLSAGDNFDDVIEKELDKVNCVIVLWSSKSVKSRWVRAEAGDGLERGVLIPVLVEEVRPPLAFRRIKPGSLIGWTGNTSDQRVLQLVVDVNKILELQQENTRTGKEVKFDTFSERDVTRREKISDLINRTTSNLERLSLVHLVRDTQRLNESVNRSELKILFTGEFNSGKSTLINALLGEHVVPTRVIPSTPFNMIIRWGASPKVLLHFQDQNKKPLLISIKDLDKYTSTEFDDNGKCITTPFSHAEIYFPSQLLMNNIEFIDSPGLNVSQEGDQKVEDQLADVDVVLFLISSTSALASFEMNKIDMLSKSGHKELFFILNKSDLLKTKRHRDILMERFEEILDKSSSLKNSFIYFLSAIESLEGQIEKDHQKLQKSGFEYFVRDFSRFLTIARKRFKAVRILNQLRYIINVAQKESTSPIHYLNTPKKELVNIDSEANTFLQELLRLDN